MKTGNYMLSGFDHVHKFLNDQKILQASMSSASSPAVQKGRSSRPYFSLSVPSKKNACVVDGQDTFQHWWICTTVQFVLFSTFSGI